MKYMTILFKCDVQVVKYRSEHVSWAANHLKFFFGALPTSYQQRIHNFIPPQSIEICSEIKIAEEINDNFFIVTLKYESIEMNLWARRPTIWKCFFERCPPHINSEFTISVPPLMFISSFFAHLSFLQLSNTSFLPQPSLFRPLFPWQ